MFSDISDDLKLGILSFAGMTVFVLLAMRLTRQSRVLREKIKFPLILIYVMVTLYGSLHYLNLHLPQRVEAYYLAVLYLSASILGIRLLLTFVFDVFLVKVKQIRVPRLIKEISGVVLFTIAFVVILQDTLKIQLTTVLATSALITVVVGLALQETLGNLFAGVSLHMDPPYQGGDWIHVGELWGKVEEITWRATKLRTVNNDLVVIPNGQIAKERLINHSYPTTPHATSVYVGVAYSVPPNKVVDVMNEILSGHENVSMNPPPDIRVNSFDDFAVKYQVKFFLKEYGLIESTLAGIRRAIWYHFRRAEIEIPLPIRNIYLHEREEALTAREHTLRRLSDSLKKVYLFSLADEEERRLLADHLIAKHFARKEMIINEGEEGDSLFIIDHGEVEVFLTSASGSRKVLNTLHEGDFFGEMALLTGQRRSASVQATMDVCVYELQKQQFKEVLERKPDILDEISSVLSRRKERLADIMAEQTGGQLDESAMTAQEAKSRILNRIRNYFGL